MPTTEQPHRTIVTTDFAPDEVIVRGGQGAWFKVLNDLIDHGTAAAIKGDGLLLLLIHLRHRDQEGVSRLSIDDLCRISQRHRSTVFRAHDQLLNAEPMLLRRIGDALWEPLPDRGFLGQRPRSQFCDPPSRNPATQSRISATPEPEVRALRTNQPDKTETKTQNQSLGQTQSAGALKGEVAGWSGLGLFWDPEACSTVEDLLRKLDVGEQLRFHIGRLAGITVAEVASVARAVAADPGVEKPVPILAWRLFNRRGLKVPSTSGLQLTGALARIQQIRNARVP